MTVVPCIFYSTFQCLFCPRIFFAGVHYSLHTNTEKENFCAAIAAIPKKYLASGKEKYTFLIGGPQGAVYFRQRKNTTESQFDSSFVLADGYGEKGYRVGSITVCI